MKSELKLFRAFLERLAPVDDDAWAAMLSLLTLKRLKKREYFIAPGDRPREVAYVLKGLLESSRCDEKGKEAIKRFAPEDTLSTTFMELILGQPSISAVRALEPTTYLAIDYQGWKKAMDRFMCLQKIGRLIAEHEFVERERREVQFMLLDARGRLAEFKRLYPGLLARVPANRIAVYLGINPVTLSRLRAKS